MQHSHELSYVQWFPMPGHIHPYRTRTTFNDGHRHGMSGRTSPPSGRGPRHIHYYEGTTSFDDGHVHFYRGWTGPPIPLPGGNHYHEFFGQTTFNDGHVHYYRGRTGENYRPGR